MNQKPNGDTGMKKNSIEQIIRKMLTHMKVDFLPNRRASGTVQATPIILATSPMLKNNPA